ncbi:MAG: ATP-dependent zinc metalloprotease FtsH [Fimbriimonadales bacterium]
MSRSARTFFILAAVGIVLFYVFISGKGGVGAFGNHVTEISQANLIEYLNNGSIKNGEISNDTFTGTLKDGTKIRARVRYPYSDELNAALDKSPQVKAVGSPLSEAWLPLLTSLMLPIGLALAFWFFIFRPAQQSGNQALSFGRSRARRLGENVPKTTFADVAGVEEAKQELSEIVDFLRNQKKYVAVGAKIPKGVLLLGPPGCGKTLLARAVAGEAGVPFFHISGSDFVEMFVGVGAARVRDLFETAKAHRPSLIFVDEIDAVGRQRGAGLGGGHDEREQTLNQLLVEMDGFDPNIGVILLAATNRPDVLDPALLRPGRFDRQVVVDAPDQLGREAILKVHAKGKPLADDVDLSVLAKRTSGMTGADLANVLNEAALLAARKDQTEIRMQNVEEALDRVIAGPERSSRVLDPKEREVIAYHEAGHAIVGEMMEHGDRVYKITILPRGLSLGSTWMLPERDRHNRSRSELLDMITGLLGGRIAEELVFNETTTGAREDLQRVTELARAMVCEYGMSEKLGTLTFGRRHGNPFLGRDIMEDRNFSEDVARAIDQEVREIVDSCHRRATEILIANRDKLDELVKALLEKETIGREEFLAILKGAVTPEGTRVEQRLAGAESPAPADETEAEDASVRVKQPRPGLEPGPA